MSQSFTPISALEHQRRPHHRRRDNPNELFVGNLTFFCEEQDLYNLFSYIVALNNTENSRPNPISSVRIIRSDNSPSRSLLFGFVCLANIQDCHFAVERLEGAMFMGRKLK